MSQDFSSTAYPLASNYIQLHTFKSECGQRDSNPHGLTPSDFLTTLCHHSRIKRCSLEHVFTISMTQVVSVCSLHSIFYKIKNLARRSVIAFAVLANFYSKSFLLGTLYEKSQPILIKYENGITLKSDTSAYSVISANN